MASQMTVEQYLINFTSIVKWDIDKLVDIAEKGLQIQNQLNHRASGTGLGTSTQLIINPIPTPTADIENGNSSIFTGSGIPPQKEYALNVSRDGENPIYYRKLKGNAFLEQHTPEKAKCAIPMAISLIGAAEFIGALLCTPNIWEDGNKFDRAIQKFFDYVGFPIHRTEKEVLRQSFRNGMAHNFMMQGEDVAIDYHNSYQSKEELIFIENGQIILNVIKLKSLVYSVMEKLPEDLGLHPTIANSLKEYETGLVAQKTAERIKEFKDYLKTK